MGAADMPKRRMKRGRASLSYPPVGGWGVATCN